MAHNETIRTILKTHRVIADALLDDPSLTGKIGEAAQLFSGSLLGGGTVFAFGNGGSAADAQHFASELVGRFSMERKGLRAVALTTDASVLTSLSNDFGYDEVFARQIEALGNAGDTVLAISTSGSSPNVISGIKTAARLGLNTVGLTGRGGGAMAELCTVCITISSDDTPRIQEAHVLVYHILCELIEKTVCAG